MGEFLTLSLILLRLSFLMYVIRSYICHSRTDVAVRTLLRELTYINSVATLPVARSEPQPSCGMERYDPPP